MMGSAKNPGVIPLTLDYMFDMVGSREREAVDIRVSYVEVYNEVIRDLLTSDDAALDIREDPERGIIISNVLELPASNQDQIMRMFKLGSRNRIKESTEANEASSRSHAVFILTIEAKDPETGDIKIAKLNMIDLAGSERAAYTNNKGMRMREGANINKSLLALGNCINALAGMQKDKGGFKRVHVPYRDSKLTRLLKESLCGNCRTVMICNVSPAITAYEDTYNTLKYADRAKSIKTYSKKNVKQAEPEASTNNMTSEYADMISKLKQENLQLKSLVQKKQYPIGEPTSGVGSSNMLAPSVDDATLKTIQNMEKKIIQEYQAETEALTRYYAAEDNLDNLKQSIVKSLGKVDESTKSYLTNLRIMKQQCEEQLQRIQEQRETVKREIDMLPKNQFSYEYCISLYDKEQAKLKNLIAKRKRTQNENSLKYLNWANMFLKNQVKLRDNILYEQKLILDRNQVDNNISYDGLKAIDRLEASIKKSVDDALPVLNTNNMNRGRIYSGNKQARVVSQHDRYSRRGSNHSMSQPRLPMIGIKAGYQAARNKYYKPNPASRSIGSAGPKKLYELPDSIKSRIQYNQNGHVKRPVLKSSFEDRSLTYGRKLHAAIYQRNQMVASSRNASRKPTYQTANQPKRKVGLPSSISQPYLQQRKFTADYHKSPYLKAFNERQPEDRQYQTPEALRLLKQKMPGAI